MDKETMIELFNAKVDSLLLSVLIDTILDNTRLDYEYNLELRDRKNEIINLIKAFRSDEYKNRVKELKKGLATEEPKESEEG